MIDNYVVYHLHSDLSNGVTNIDSVTKYIDYVEHAKKLSMKAMAFSEHGSVFEWVKKKEAINSAGMKYIHAEEFYVTATLEEKIRDNRHVVLIARNYEGVKELNRLSSIAFRKDDNHKHYNPRITIDELCDTSDNIIVTTACLGGILNYDNYVMKDKFITFLSKNKHRCFLEIQHHNVQDQIDYNKYLYSVSKNLGVPLIAGTDTHALSEKHLEGRRILQLSKKIHFENEEGWNLKFLSFEELIHAYEVQKSLPMDVVMEAIDNTNRLADMIEDFTLDKSYKYPHLWEDSEAIFKCKIEQGIKKRGVDKYSNYDEYLKRIDHEFETYKHNKSIDFMLLMVDIIDWCNENDIKVGYGRGSVNGSIIAWLLGITEMDSIKHKLNFERFMNPERVSLADIDTDFPPSRIDDVKKYIFNREGLNCCDIITFNTIADRGAIKDVGRALNIPLSEVSAICEIVDNEEEYAKARQKYKELFSYVDIVKGTIVSIGSHPCGVMVYDKTIDDEIGLCTTSTDEYPISQIYMKEIDSLNYVKLDLLKLDTIELINETCKLAGIERLTPDNVDIYDINVWNSMRDDTTQIFQWEGNTGNDYIKKLLSDDNINKFKAINEQVDRMTLLSIGNSAIRPAGASYREDLAKGVIRKTGSKPIDDFLSDTFGYLVFQCQIIDFLHKYCGFTMGEADIVRRGFAKKTGTGQYIPIIKTGGYFSEESDHYIEGFIKTMKNQYGIDEEKSEQDIVAFIKVIEDASAYLFSLNHSQPYSYEGYACAWLRYYYPLEFLTCALNINIGKEDKTNAVTAYAKQIGIKINPIKFGHSSGEYSCDKEANAIYKGISSVKFITDKIANQIRGLYGCGNYNFIILLKNIKDNTSLNSKQLDILIKLDFFSDYGGIKKLLHLAYIFSMLYGKKVIFKTKTILDPEMLRNYCDKETNSTYKFSGDAIIEMLEEYEEVLTCTDDSIADKIKYQMEFLGYIDYVDENANDRLIVVTDLDTKYTPKFKGYNLKTGNICEFRVAKNKRTKDCTTFFDTCPFENGDIIIAKKYKKKPKQRKTENGFEVVQGEYNWWVTEYDRYY